MIPYGRQSINEADIQAVVEVLRSDYLTQGPAVPRFEQAVAGYCGAPYAVAVNSATSALHIACLALGLQPGDQLWTVPNTFVASANCALYCGAKVDFVDIDPDSLNLSIGHLERKLAASERDGKLPKVVVPVHFSGQPCAMEEIWKLSKRYGFYVIEDASHAIGASYHGHKVGDCAFSHATVLSFHPVKIVTTGEGGVVLTADTGLHDRLKLLRNHGITREQRLMLDPSEGPWYYQQVALGYNYRMTDMQAALGVSQMLRLDELVGHRRFLADRYDQKLGSLPLILPRRSPGCESAWHLYVVQLAAAVRKARRAVFDELRAEGIGVNVHYIPVHTQPHYRNLGFAPGDFPASEAYYKAAISLPLYAGLSERDQDFVVAKLANIID